MTLSICCLTDAPGAQIRAMLQPLREVADEIVIAADQRVDPADVSAYGTIADRVLRFEFEFLEAHLAWLHAECAGDWVFRLDGDEEASPELIDVLPELIATPDVRQYWFPRRWLDSSGRGWLDELPWAPDYQNRLVRNDSSLSFEGVLHTNALPVYPARYRPEPFYHHLCRLETREERLAHGLSYEIQRPHILAPGGGSANARFYLPERFARRRPKALSQGPSIRGSRSMRLLEPDLRMYEGEVRGLFVEVTNDSGLDWPGGMEEPLVRLSYRWREDPIDRERTPLPAPLAQGESAIMPVTVTAPAEPGRYGLQLDLVHEHVRWLKAGIHVTIDVVPSWPDAAKCPRASPAVCWARQPNPPRLPPDLAWVGADARGGERRSARPGPGTIRTGSIACGATTTCRSSASRPRSSPAQRTRSSCLTSPASTSSPVTEVCTSTPTSSACARSIRCSRGSTPSRRSSGPARSNTALLGAIAGHPAFRRAAELVVRDLRARSAAGCERAAVLHPPALGLSGGDSLPAGAVLSVPLDRARAP